MNISEGIAKKIYIAECDVLKIQFVKWITLKIVQFLNFEMTRDGLTATLAFSYRSFSEQEHTSAQFSLYLFFGHGKQIFASSSVI